jgi:hypothetical protein
LRKSSPGLGPRRDYIEEQATESHSDREWVGQLVTSFVLWNLGSQATREGSVSGARAASAAWTRFARRGLARGELQAQRRPLGPVAPLGLPAAAGGEGGGHGVGL